MEGELIELPWLPQPPDDFREQIREFALTSSPPSSVAERLAKFSLSGSKLHALGTVIGRIVARDEEAVRLAVLSNGTTDLLLPAIAVSTLRHREWVRTFGTAFDQVAAEALNPSSQINQARCHFVLLCLDHRGLPLNSCVGDIEKARAAVDAALSYIDSLRESLHAASGCSVIVQTLPQIAASLFGSCERMIPGTLQWLIDKYNHQLRERIAGSSDLLLDVAALAETVGLSRWHNPVQWNLGKFLFAQNVVPLYADWVGRLIAAARGKARKCLVLDLDNTLWGGIIGDDGLAGIVLGNGNPTGEAFLKVQQTALALRERGVVLAVSSKNDDAVARCAFRSHPEMLLKEEHIAVFQANWQDKASNLKAIAEALNIGIDALVLLDDNPAERAQVRDALPAVAVPDLPADPALYADALLAAGYFEAIGFTAEDRLRAQQYRDNAARAQMLGAATDLESYLRSLRMRAIFGPFDEVSRNRITQLINKTNQFNLTTHRYTEAQVRQFEQAGSGLTLQVRLVDTFGDNGVIAIVICVEEDADWLIDTWLMSCRVLNRKVEHAMLNYIVERAAEAGARSLIGQYIKTERNGMVEDHYSRLGFVPLHVGEKRSIWQLDVASYVAASVPMEIDAIEPKIDEERAVLRG